MKLFKVVAEVGRIAVLETVLALVIAGLVFQHPQISYAQNGTDHQPIANADGPAAAAVFDDGAAEHKAYPSSPEHLAVQAIEVFHKDGKAGRLQLSDAQRNAFYLLKQNLVNIKTGSTDDLSKLNLARPQVIIPVGLLETSLTAKLIEGGIELSYKGAAFAHQIFFNAGETAQSITHDNEFLNVLLNTGVLLTIEVGGLRKMLFACSVPVFTVGKLFTDQVDPLAKIRYIQRRAPSLDRSTKAQEAVLDRRDSSRRHLIAIANDKTLEAVEQNFEKLKYLPLSAGVEADYPFLTSGDLAVVQLDVPLGETITKIVPRGRIAQDVGNQATAFQGLLALASEDTAAAIEEISKLNDEAKAQIDALVNDDSRVKEYFDSGLAEAVALIPKASVRGIIGHAASSTAQESTASSRDRFTAAEWAEDTRYFNETIELAKTSATEAIAPTWMRRVGHAASERWQNLFKPKSVQKLTTMLKCAAAACVAYGTDQLFGGTVTAASVDFLAGSLHWTYHQFPVLLNAPYSQLLALSVASQAMLPVLVYGAAALASPFTQGGIMRLPPMAGIRAYAFFFQISPLRVLSFFTGQRVAFNALKRGFVVGPNVALGEQRAANEAAVNRIIRAKTLKPTLATIVALGVVGYRAGVDPGELYVSASGIDTSTQIGLDTAMEISADVRERLSQITTSEMETLLNQNAGELVGQLKKYREASAAISLPSHKDGWWARWSSYIRHKVKFSVLKSIGNYNEETYQDLARAVPDDFTGRLITRGYIIDFNISLLTAASTGDWANLAEPNKLHAQADGFLWSSKMVTAENVHQTFIHMGRGAAGDYLVFSAEASGVNVAHQPAELQDMKDDEVTSRKGFIRESVDFAKTMFFNLRHTNLGELVGKSMYNGRVKLFQSTVLTGLSVRYMLGGQPLEQALLGQLTFMASAMWMYGWPWIPIKGTQQVHEAAIEEKYKAFKTLQMNLSQAARLGTNEQAEAASTEMMKFYDEKSELSYPEFPERTTEESGKEYAVKLFDYTKQNPSVANTYSGAIANIWTSVAAVVTTVLATYLYSSTFAGDLTWTAVNLTDWDLFTHVPEHDGVISLTVKSTILASLMWGGQRFFNWGWDSARLNIPHFMNPKTPEERATLEKRAADAKAAALDFRPVKITIGAAKSIKNIFTNGCSLLFGNE
jgi:hypothetical protein